MDGAWQAKDLMVSSLQKVIKGGGGKIGPIVNDMDSNPHLIPFKFNSKNKSKLVFNVFKNIYKNNYIQSQDIS